MLEEEVHVTKASEVDASTGGQTEGMIRQGAIINKSDKASTSDTIIYAASGHGTVVSGPNGCNRQKLSPGDFALIPAYAEHQELNDGDEEVTWIITRSGRSPVVENLEGWGKSHEHSHQH
ncbi:MAG: hypothetical protein M1827_001976 [Pycnora praestabilis]|nr:MAG: hypothetical protein M1827_001976 [Pycnora praestabilis]